MKLARTAQDLASEGFRPVADPDALSAFEPADPTPLALAARDEARALAGERAELGEMWEREIAAYKAALRATARATTAAQKAVGAWALAAYPAPESLIVAASDALRTAAALAAEVTHPDIEAVRAKVERQARDLVRLDRVRGEACREAMWALATAESAVRRGSQQDAATAIHAARERVKLAEGLGGTQARMEALGAAWFARLGVRQAG
jgi:hypothetical protein